MFRVVYSHLPSREKRETRVYDTLEEARMAILGNLTLGLYPVGFIEEVDANGVSVKGYQYSFDVKLEGDWELLE